MEKKKKNYCLHIRKTAVKWLRPFVFWHRMVVSSHIHFDRNSMRALYEICEAQTEQASVALTRPLPIIHNWFVELLNTFHWLKFSFMSHFFELIRTNNDFNWLMLNEFRNVHGLQSRGIENTNIFWNIINSEMLAVNS